MRFKATLTFIMLILPVLCPAQDLNGKILMNIAGKNTEAGEFIRMYKKSIVAGQPADVDQYLQQFIAFKLKVADAINEKLDASVSFKNELKGYRDQLAQNFLTDQTTKEKLLRKSYQRYLTEINAWHILVACPPELSPEDTLLAWTKVNEIRERIISGESFELVARGTSDDKAVMINGGNLGWFTAFQMIMPFEDAAYNLKKGEISQPVRTPYGYHIIRVNDIRPSRGKVLTAHIMKAIPPGASEKVLQTAEAEINRIYQELQKGVPFDTLAKSLSDHKESGVNGGKLNWFGAGEMITDFSEAAFSLKDTGTYTKPVKTLYGWHIIKLLDKKKVGSYEETRSFLESKLNQSYLNALSRKSLIEKLKQDYKLKIEPVAYQWFISNTDTLVIQGLKKYSRESIPQGNLYSFANQKFTAKEFASFLEKRGNMIDTDDSVTFINNSLETRVSDHIIAYENSVLEKKYPDFRYLMNEFHDGILLFEISGKKIWNRVKEDSTGLQQYYELHKKEYLSPQKIEAKIYRVVKPGMESKFIAAYNKNSSKADTEDLLLKKFNKKGRKVISVEEGSWIKGENELIDQLECKPGKALVPDKDMPALIVITRVIDPVPLPFEEIQSEMMTGFQEQLESEWMNQLKKKYPVKVNNAVLEQVKKTLKND